MMNLKDLDPKDDNGQWVVMKAVLWMGMTDILNVRPVGLIIVVKRAGDMKVMMIAMTNSIEPSDPDSDDWFEDAVIDL